MMMVSDEEKRWIVVGIAMFKVAAPVLRDVVKQGMDTHYTNLDARYSGLHTPCTLKTMTYLQVNADPSLKHLKFQNVNNNFHLHGKNRNLYNYCINDSIDLAKLYLPDYLAQFSAFDDSLDMAAILRLLGFANYLPSAVFSAGTQASADDVRENVRNEWGHFDVNEWTDAFFKACFAKLETLVKNLGLTAGVETTTLDQLNDWQTKGCQLCMGHAVDQNLLSLVQQDVKELIKKYRETNTQQAAIQISLDQLKKEHEDLLHQQEQQMKGQEQQMKEQEQQMKEQEEQMKEQEQQMKEQEQQMKEQEEQMKEQEEQMKEQEQQMKEQEEQMKEQEEQMKEQEQQMKEQEQQMKEQEQQMKGQEQQMKEQEEQIKGQEQQMKEQEQQMKGQEQQMKGQEQQMKGQEEQMKEQEEQIKGQEQQMKEQEEQMKEQEQQMKEQEQQIKESKEVLEKLVSVEKNLREELLIRVQGVEEGLAQTDERVKQLEEDFKGQRLKCDGPDGLGASSQERTVLHCSSVQGSQPSCSKGTACTGSSATKQSVWSKVKEFFKQDAFLKWSRNQLRSFYNSTMSQVMITPWNPDDTVHIDEVYVKLSFLRDDRKPDVTTKVKIKNYREIFQSHGRHVSPKRIVVYGRPGIGKSTFSKKLAVDWSRSKKILKKFDVLLLVKLRDVCDTQDLRSMLEKAELLSADDPTVFDRLDSFIVENQQKVLLVLDGYDEYSGEKSSPVHQIWRGTQLRDCSVLMTSRPTKEEELVTPSHAQFEISGFSAEEVTQFAFKIFKNREDVSRFTHFLSERSLWDMAEIPLLLLMLCLTWKEKGLEELAASRANIYDSFLETLFNHMAAKHRGKAFTSLDDYKEALAKLGEFAFDALLVDCLYLKLDILPGDTRALIEKLIEVGFFQISKLSRSVRPVQVLFFLHKSIQEFLSARFIIRELKNAEKGDFTCLMKIDSLEKIKKFIEVLKFVCELSSEAASIVLSHLRSVGEKEGLTECGFSDTPSVKELSENQREFRVISLDCMLSCPVSQRQDVLYSQFLQCVNSVVVIDDRQCPVVAREHLLRVSRRVAPPDYLFFSARFFTGLSFKLSIMGDLETVFVTPNGATKVNAGFCSGLKVNHFYLKAEGQQMVLCLTHIVKYFSDQRLQPVELLRAFTLAQESLSQKPVDHASQNQDVSSGQENTSALVLTHSLSFVREIELLSPLASETSRVLNVLNGPRIIRIFGFQPETCSAQLIETLVSCIPFTINLYELELAYINLTAKSVADIAKSLFQAPHLKKLKLGNTSLLSTVSYLAENLHHVSQLNELSLRSGHIGEEECQSVAAALKHFPSLKVLDLSINPLGQGISELAKQFIHVPDLTELNLSGTRVGEEEVTAVARSLQNISNLEQLDLSSNPLHQGITKLAKNFIHVRHLTRLELRNTQMGEEEVTAVARSLQSISNLKRLDLSSNPLHQGITTLAKNFIHVPHLTTLKLTDTQMGEEEVTAVAHALKNVPELGWLDLSDNPLGRGVGELTKHLSSITKLMCLVLVSVKMTKKEASDLCTAAQEKDFRIWSDCHVRLGVRLRTDSQLKEIGFAFDKE